MADVEVYIIHAEVLKALVEHALHMLLPGHARLDFGRAAPREFRRDDDLLPPRKIAQRPADKLLARAVLVDDRRVKKVDPVFQRIAEDLPRLRLVERPAVLAGLRVSEAHAAEAHARNAQHRAAKLCVFHFQRPFRSILHSV